jgi:O-methyltransferase
VLGNSATVNPLRSLIKRFGYDIVRSDTGFDRGDLAVIRRVEPFTMTSPARLVGVMDAVRYIVANGIEGDFAECGVWRGGSMMAAALTLLECGDTSRRLHLFDTFEGMPAPTDADVSHTGRAARDMMAALPRKDGHSVWCFASLEDVQQNLASTAYPEQRLHFVQGKVEDTIPVRAPEKLALLRLDTDWYDSTKHELEHLYPRLVAGGVLIIDDYGHWLGARRAVDEYFAKARVRPLLNRLDYTGRLAIKPSE